MSRMIPTTAVFNSERNSRVEARHRQIAESVTPSYGCSTNNTANAPMSSPRWKPGESGNVAGRRPGSRNRLSEEVISSFLRDWRKHGDKALEKVRRTQPAAYCKLAVLLVPREHKVEHHNTYEGLTTEQIEAYIAEIQDRLDRRAAGEQATVIDGEAVETTAVATTTPLVLEPPKRRSNRLMMEADTAIGSRERTPRKRKMSLPPGA